MYPWNDLSAMGFPLVYPQVLPPNLLLPALSLLILFEKLAFALFRLLGVSDDIFFFLDGTGARWEANALAGLHHHQDSVDTPEFFQSPSTALQTTALPVVRFSTLLAGDGGGGRRDRAESCTVCLHELKGDDEIMLPMNCRHVFHRVCLDRWIGYNHRMCPLCRAPLGTEDDH